MTKIDKQLQGKQNLEWGKEAEQIAMEHILLKGYALRERNWRMNHTEIDLIFEHNRTIIFVEVKARASNSITDPLSAVDARKRRLLVTAADVYMRSLPYLYEYRFDIFAITGNRDNYECHHYEDAFMPEIKTPANRKFR